ncbi:potassium-transporting ATPase subunit F [Streptomyces sp. NPDC004126]
MNAENAIGLIIAIVLLGNLVTALIEPERF